MSSIHLRQPLARALSRGLLAFFLGSMLIACSANPVTTSRPSQLPTSCAYPGSSPTQSLPALPEAADRFLTPNASNLTVDIGCLQMQSETGFQCPDEWYGPSPLALDQLVLTSDRLTYTQDEIAQMRSYTSGASTAYQALTTGATPPPTLRWVLGGSMEEIPGTLPSNLSIDSSLGTPDMKPSCGARLDLTNTGNSDIQISKVGVQVTESPQSNTYQYRLIDVCSFMSADQGQCTPAFGGQDQCDEYRVDIQLGAGKKHAVFSGLPVPSDPSCGPLTIAPDSTLFLIIQFSPTPEVQNNVIDRITPLITLNTGQGEQTYSLPRLASTLAFANASQFSCYQLHGSTFVLISSPIFALNFWCV